MDFPQRSSTEIKSREFLSGGGEMGERIRAFDWSKTPMGPAERWSPALKTFLQIMLANRFPMLLWWGQESISIYNDAYIPVLGVKHPEALGLPVRQCWSEIYDVLRPLILTPLSGGPPTWSEDLLLEIRRHGFLEETHWTVAYSPVPDETATNGIGGVLATVHEITGQIVGQRRNALLRDLGAHSGEAKTAEDACAAAASVFIRYPHDVPFALIYLLDQNGRAARLAATAGDVKRGGAESPSVIDFTDESDVKGWPLAQAVRTESAQLVEDLGSRFAHVPSGPWPDLPRRALVIPVKSTLAHHLAGILVVGLNPRLDLDDSHRSFFDLVTSQLATAIASARAFEEERRRAEALAEIDRTKTAFFSNVSHEFRTPLTLMLGPIEELLSQSHTELSPFAKSQLEAAHRNSLRMLRLVNTLLDFSRTEAGRVQAIYEPTDLAAFTAELASVFRAATEQAKLRLIVDCPALAGPVYVDRDMWEKIVLNLVSNAFKFTFEGEIAVSLRAMDGMAELRIRDTGVGIPTEEMPRLFERFHRVQNMRSRTHEGSGIGLALVQDLVKLHGGTIRTESRLGEGTTFIIAIPFGKDHLRAEHIGSSRALTSSTTGAAPFVEEALRWLPQEGDPEKAEPMPREELLPIPCPVSKDENRPRVLVADDNPDMRQYLARLLSEHYQVQVVPDGQAALTAARTQPPDLVLSDVMMPLIDGLELVQRLRADPNLSTVPIILLSARAGEESRVEGLEYGADDYLIKPFSARELLARVASHLDMARLRKQAEAERKQLLSRISDERERLQAILGSINDEVWFVDLEGNLSELTRVAQTGLGLNVPDGKPLIDVVRGLERLQPDGTPCSPEETPLFRSLKGETLHGEEMIRHIKTGEMRHRRYSSAPVRNNAGHIVGAVAVTTDITDRKKAEEALKKAYAEMEQRVQERTSELSESVERLRAENIQRKRLEEILRDSENQVRFFASQCLTAQETERRRIAGELHDSIAASIAAAKFRIENIAEQMKQGNGGPDGLDDVSSKLMEINNDVRRIMADLRPSILDDLGIIPAIDWFCREFEKTYSSISVEKQVGISDFEVPESLKTPIFRICQEAMNNIAKYSKASLVNLLLRKEDGKIQFAIQDNGQGFDLETVKKGMGLSTMKERAELSGGSFEIESAVGKGTTVRVSWPI